MNGEQARAPVLTLAAVRKVFGQQVAVDSLTLTLHAEEFMTFLGPSGSGKTTTLMMVAGLQSPDAGRITLNGAPVDGLPPYRRDIGMVFQHYALFPHMTVARNIAFPLELRGVRRREIRRRVAEVLQLVNLPEYGDRLPRQLSGGQQQRVALARALVYHPALLLMDEPLGALDRKLRGQLQLEIMRLHRERRMSVLYVTHDQEEALTMSDRIAVFNAGRIEQIGTPTELYERPISRFVASFIGETNFLPGRVVGSRGPTADVRVGGAQFEARNPDGLAEGDAAVVAVRPERTMMGPHAASGLIARIETVIYLGNARHFLLRLADGSACTALLHAGAADLGGIAENGAVSLSFRPEHAVLFAA